MKLNHLLSLLEAKAGPDLAAVEAEAIKIIYAGLAAGAMRHRESIADYIDGGGIEMDPIDEPLRKLLDKHEGSEKLRDKLARKSASFWETMFKAEHGVSSRKWGDAANKKDLAALPKNERELLADLSDRMIVDATPHSIADDFQIYKYSPKGLGVRGWGQEIILRPAFFQDHGMTIEDGRAFLLRLGASEGKRPKRPGPDRPIYD